MLLIIPHDHRYWVGPGDRWEFFWISMSGQEAVRIHRAVHAMGGPVLRLRPDTIEHLASCSLRLVEGAGETPGSASSIAYEAAMALYDDVFGSQSTASLTGEDNPIRRAIAHIGANLDKPLPVPALADIAGLSRAHFSRMFVASEGVPPAVFVLQERLRKAGRLLSSHAHLPVKEIAVLCGFDDPNYFAKVFRRSFGTSPTEFRTTGMYSAPLTEPFRARQRMALHGGGDEPKAVAG